MVRRSDASTISARRDASGMLRGTAKLTRTGVLAYRTADGSTRRELRHPDEVFKADSLATLSLVPITLGHPSEAVTSKNAKRNVVGAIGDGVKADGKFVRAPFVIHDDAAIAEVESGRAQECSCGYNCDLDYTPGVFEGEAYDAVQRNIEYNHVAVLPKGRAGPEVRIDGDDAIEITDRNSHSNAPNARQEDNMKTIRIDGVDYNVDSPAFDQAFAKFTAAQDVKIANLEKLAADAKTDADKQRARADALDADCAKLKTEAAPEAIAKKINDRVALVAKAAKVLGAEFKADGKTDDEVKRAVILKITPKATLDGQSADYVSARFDHIVETFKQDAAIVSVSALRTDLAHADTLDADDDVLDDTKVQAAMAERNRNAWKGAKA